MNCSNCGMPHPEGRLYCTNCGHSLQNPEVPTQVVSASQNKNTISNPAEAASTSPEYAKPYYTNEPGQNNSYVNTNVSGVHYGVGFAGAPGTSPSPRFQALKNALKDGSLWIKIARISVYVMGGLIVLGTFISVVAFPIPFGAKILLLLLGLIFAVVVAVISMTFSMLFINQADHVKTLTKQNEEIIELLKNKNNEIR